MTYREKIEKELEQAYREYQTKIELIAERVQKEKIIPFLDKHKYRFINGMGLWDIREIDREDVPEKIADILDINLGGMNMSLGEMMPWYPKED